MITPKVGRVMPIAVRSMSQLAIHLLLRLGKHQFGSTWLGGCIASCTGGFGTLSLIAASTPGDDRVTSWIWGLSWGSRFRKEPAPRQNSPCTEVRGRHIILCILMSCLKIVPVCSIMLPFCCMRDFAVVLVFFIVFQWWFSGFSSRYFGAGIGEWLVGYSRGLGDGTIWFDSGSGDTDSSRCVSGVIICQKWCWCCYF